ncbi:DUF397 domain-containing protein [Streptomyces sp. NRRL F-5126]|uniref:DUF397 domain-containing protein n=1 Tax=Streptomyces sp. NRRL F-5126 TaxID=1463857 RepID=UPI0004C86477|nr:DUF397 domain-containing protein [Streptomyces sp. NRRL F-5126]
MRSIDLTSAAWRKSSYSNSDGGECVEIATNLPAVLPVRDSKNPHGPALLLPRRAWTAFVTALKGDAPASV